MPLMIGTFSKRRKACEQSVNLDRRAIPKAKRSRADP